MKALLNFPLTELSLTLPLLDTPQKKKKKKKKKIGEECVWEMLKSIFEIKIQWGEFCWEREKKNNLICMDDLKNLSNHVTS